MQGVTVKPATSMIGAAPLAVLLFALAACQSSPAPDQMSRTTLETAPADLQLICANAAAQSRGVESSTVLPVSSRKLDAKSYEVDLNAGGTTMKCVVDGEGNVVSVQPA
jgi:hypothetical protein